MRRINFSLIFLGLFLCAISLCLAQVEFRITPSIIELSLSKGGTKVFFFELTNDNKESPLRFRILPMDLDVNREGGTEFLDVGKSPYSCSKWVTVEPKEIEVEPGHAKKIIAKLNVPAAAKAGGYYSAIVCELVTKRPPKVETGAIIRWRVASLLKVTVLGGRIEKKAALEDLLLRTLFEKEEEARKGLNFIASLRNEGNVHIKAEGKLVVLTPDRKRRGEVDFDVGTGTVLPGHIRDFVAVYDKFLTEGDYIAHATFRYGGASTLEKEIPFSVRVGRQAGAKEEAFVIPSLKIIPEEINLKIPAGGFRISGITIQNQRTDNLLIRASFDKDAVLRDWFTLEPQEVRLEGGREAKILLKCNIPQNAKPGEYKTKINLSLAIISDKAQETLEPVSIGVNIEIPRF